MPKYTLEKRIFAFTKRALPGLVFIASVGAQQLKLWDLPELWIMRIMGILAIMIGLIKAFQKEKE